MTTTAGRRAASDAQGAAAVDLAREALVEVAGDDQIGDHLGVEADDERVVTHLFECRLPGYRGWRWAVTVARASRAKSVTVDEVVLLPGPDALLAPAWVPWSDRLRPGDLGVGDLLPTAEDDARLEPGWNDVEAAVTDTARDGEDEDVTVDLATVALSLDLVRARVLSPVGYDDAVDRWLSGDHGPDSSMAQAAPASCATCGFRVPLGGRLGRVLGLCANEYSPSDGHAVALEHGCGAHSQAATLPAAQAAAPPVIDEIGFDAFDA